MEDKSREVVMAISNAARYMDPFFGDRAVDSVFCPHGKGKKA